ncbi:uncharacterized protein LOC129735548 [Falco cherrug]|uniref:uncharacterized protein LOC129735548 n=1 Tax=Falco cherrug TaxID=345164 RepID=UPI002479237E|nr:uncharacterized protein LOC129735548 [Falco cherrug]
MSRSRMGQPTPLKIELRMKTESSNHATIPLPSARQPRRFFPLLRFRKRSGFSSGAALLRHGQIPPSAHRQVGHGQIPPSAHRQVGHGQIPPSAHRQVGHGQIPPSAHRQVGHGQIPLSAHRQVGHGQIPPSAHRQTSPLCLPAGNKQQPLGCQDDASTVSKSSARVRHCPGERKKPEHVYGANPSHAISSYADPSIPSAPCRAPHLHSAYSAQTGHEGSHCTVGPRTRRLTHSSRAKAAAYLARKTSVPNPHAKVLTAGFQSPSDICAALCPRLHCRGIASRPAASLGCKEGTQPRTGTGR